MYDSMSEEKERNEDHLDWAEKYRPVSLSDVAGNDAAVKALKKWLSRTTWAGTISR
jgi:hypothetical protein